jgi:dethiobiotin synthetase
MFNQGRKVFVTGIGTDVGKTVVAAALVQLWGAAYWKPVQSGTEISFDSDTVRSLISYPVTIFPEIYALRAPLSPHVAAELDHTTIQISNIDLPLTEKDLVIEGAGGVLVPLNSTDLIIDLIKSLKVPVILVSRHYLGSINHTLLSIEALATRKIPLDGLVFIGDENVSTEKIIRDRVGCKVGRIGIYTEINEAAIRHAAHQLGVAGF